MYVKIDWQHTAAALKHRYQTAREGKRRQRLHALWLVCTGQHTVAEVGHLVGVSAPTMHAWLNWYRAGGLPALEAHRVGRAGGAGARLSLDEQALLAAYAADGAFRTIAEAQPWVADTCGVVDTYWGMRSLLDRLQIHAKVPRPVNPKADPVVQAAWPQSGA